MVRKKIKLTDADIVNVNNVKKRKTAISTEVQSEGKNEDANINR